MDDFDLRHFIDLYVGISLEASNRGLSLDDFYAHIYRTVSERTGLPEEATRYVHHPFHWALFLDKDHPLEIVESGKLNGRPKVTVINANAGDLASRIMSRYGILLEERLKKAKTFVQ